MGKPELRNGKTGNESIGYAELVDKWSQPPMEHRGVPFWSWNAKLEQSELNEQVEGFKKQGMGGFMIHVREGLETPYLSDEFMEHVKETVAKAKAERVSVWLYDEDRYSSGVGGGKVPRIGGDAVRAKALSLSVCRSFEPEESIQAVYLANILGDDLLSCVRIMNPSAEWKLLEEDNVYLIVRRHIASANEWCHGDTYPDPMNPESARIFIETTHEHYKDVIGEEFGHTVPGIFTDEPTIRGFQEGLNAPEMTWISWSDRLPEAFAEKNGYELWDTFPYLFFRGPFSPKIRHDYWKTVTELFCDSFTKQIGDWCRANGLAFAGHFCAEGDLVGATQHGGAVMPHYRYLDVPGIDTLCEQTDESLTIKQVSSVANQYGKKKVISETYGVTGWGLTFESRKWIGDWQFALGVNLLTHHLSLYTIRGCRKRDYPPSFNSHTNWWGHNRVMEDYFARLGAVLSEGRARRDVLVIHPATSVWTKLGVDVEAAEWRNQAGNTEELRVYDREFNRMVRQLLGEHYDFDLGDEMIMQEIGRIEGERLVVGEASYRVVVLPDLCNLLGSTAQLLLAYLNAGGKVLSFGQSPLFMNGEPDARLQCLTGHPRFRSFQTSHDLWTELKTILRRSVSLTDRSGREDGRLLYMRRELSDCTVVFVVNNDRDASIEAVVRIQGSGRLEEWNSLTGDRKEKAVKSSEGDVVFAETFGPADSKLYVLFRSSKDKPAHPIQEKVEVRQPLTGIRSVGSFTRTTPNALVLDQCQYRVRDEAWSGTMSVWQAQREVREKLQMRQVYRNGGLQRYFWIHDDHDHNGTETAFRFVFHVKDIPATDSFIVFEQAERFNFRLNGRTLPERPSGWYLDRSMTTVKLPSLLPGENVLEVSCAYTHDMEIEDAFLIGDFAVDNGRRIVREPEQLRFGDWCLQGYPHYCGSMIYHVDFAADPSEGMRIVMELGSYEAVTVRLMVNGRHEKSIPWRAAGTVELTDWLVDGNNRIDIEVVGSPRNLFGPLHEARSDSAWTDWWSFRPTGHDYTPEYVLHPYGLMEQFQIFRVHEKSV
ncbi:glycosyl hydrolase [Paenibacillus sp. MBLB4367]|uniref:glycosyl hydrolase n=1 Tax=Paenibacillus sp. MBLB4367 TaxID=3384767 RepID=UPI0039083A77